MSEKINSFETINTKNITRNNNDTPDIYEKFKAYRKMTQTNRKKLNEAESVISKLRSEMEMSRDVEDNLRKQLSSAQNRSIQIQSSFNKLIKVTEQIRVNEKVGERIENKLEELNNQLLKVKEEVRKIHEKASSELNLLKLNENLKSIKEVKECENDFMKLEIQSLTKEKNELKTEYELKIKTLEEKCNIAEWNYNEVKNHCEKTLLLYEKQIEEKNQIIKRYEEERKSQLEEFEPPNTTNSNTVDFTLADSTSSLNPREKTFFQKNTQDNYSQTLSKSDFKTFKVLDAKKNKNKQFPLRRKPTLDFLTESSEGQAFTNPSSPSLKRRLFSTNSNHYLA